MSQVRCPQGVLRERLSDAVGCARVVRVQRRRRYQSHLILIDDLELTFVNTCDFDVSTVCIDRRYVLEYSVKFAMKIEALGPDGRKLNILRRDEKCLLDEEPGLDYLCVRLNEPIKPGNYYVVTLTHTAQTSVITEIGGGWRRFVNSLTPYFDVYVFSIIYPINQPPAPWTQSQYHHYEVVPEYLEIHDDTARMVQEQLSLIPDGRLSFIVSENKNLALGFTISKAQYAPQQPQQQANKNSEETSSTNVVTNIVTTLITSFVSLVSLLSSVSLFFAIIGIPIFIRLTLNRLYKAFSWMFQLLSIATIALSWTIIALLLGRTTHLLSDIFALLTTLALLLLSNYIVIPKQAPIKYLRLQILTYAVLASIISLIITIIIKTTAIIP